MSYENKEAEYESGAPKKADVLIKSTQTIVAKQEEVVEQTKLAISRIDEAIDLCHKNNEEASYILEHSTEMFDKLQSENSALKQELLYLAKQSENIYSGLAEKLNEMEKEVAPRNIEGEYKALSDELQKLREQISYIASRLDSLGAPQKDALNDKFAILYDKMDAVAKEAAKPAEAVVDNKDILDKLDKIAESMRKNENAHSMLADRFEILSMRVEQLGYGSVKQPMYSPAAPYPVPVQPVQTAEIDYDKLANKVAEILAVKDAVSPDYIASKVAEQIVLPEQLADINTQKLAREVASLIDIRPTVAVADGGVPVEINEDSLAEKIAEKLSITADASSVAIDEDALAEKIAEKLSITADSAPVAIDEDALAEKIAEKFNVVEEEGEVEESEEVKFDEDAFVEKIVARLGEIIPVGAEDIDQDELADTISLKVGSLKPEDFEILVDDDGCESISREIAQKLDYDFISTHVADKLREILEINAANAPDYEDMAERISEKITVAGINEDAIAEKAAAVLSNYLPEFDTDEIADKVSGAVIDVVAAMPQPTVDSESICNEITERLIEKQEENNYDIVIDDDGISRITAIVTEEIEKNTLDRFNKLEDSVNRIAEMLEPVEVVEDELEGDLAEEEDVVDLTESVAEITSRLDKIDEGINKLSDMLAVEEVPEEEYNTATAEEYGEEPVEDVYVTEEVSEELAARFDKLEGDIAKIYDIVSGIVVEDTEEEAEEDLGEVEENETEEYLDEQISEEDYQTISDMFTSLSARFDGVEQKIDSLSELISVEEEYAEDAEEEVEGDEEYAEEEYADELEEEEYAKLSEIIESRFNSVEQKLDSLQQLVGSAEPVTALSEPVTDDNYTALSEMVATEVKNSVAYRFDGIEEQIAKIRDIIAGLAVGEAVSVTGVVSDRVSDEAVNARLDKISEDIKEISEYLQGEAPVAVN